MRKTLTINIDEDLLNYTANCFGYEDNQNYSLVIEQALFYFLKPQISNLPHESYIEKEVDELLVEPQIDIDTIEKNYSFDLALVEGGWPGDEPIDQLIQMLHK